MCSEKGKGNPYEIWGWVGNGPGLGGGERETGTILASQRDLGLGN